MWHFRIMMHPIVMSGAVERPHSSAPRSVATRRSRPVLSWPSVCSTVRPRRSLRDERLLRLREPEFPRKTRGFDPGPPRRASAAVVSGDEDVVGFALDNARGDRPDAVLGDELDADARGRVRVLRVVDQLREIFDGVDVVMRRRRDEADAGGGHLVAAMSPWTFVPGSSPPSPGFAPCAILIWISSLLLR